MICIRDLRNSTNKVVIKGGGKREENLKPWKLDVTPDHHQSSGGTSSSRNFFKVAIYIIL